MPSAPSARGTQAMVTLALVLTDYRLRANSLARVSSRRHGVATLVSLMPSAPSARGTQAMVTLALVLT
ncbi:hypothetical protein CKF46_36300, partial [Klebsiella pneumoniae]